MKKLLLAAIIIAALTQCKKNDDPVPGVKTEDMFDNIVAARQSAVQSFTVDATNGGAITGAGGTVITFPPNFLSDANNNEVGGRVQIQLRESLTKDKWLIDGLSTITDGNALLESGGMIQVKALDAAGNELRLNPKLREPRNLDSGAVRVEIPKPAEQPGAAMMLWQQSSANSNTWAPADYYPFGNGPNSYIFQLPGFTWVNCDGLYNDPREKTTIKVVPDLSAFAGAQDMQVFIVYRNINTCITLPPSSGFWMSYANSIPIGSQADVVLMGKAAGGQVLFKVLPATTFTANMDISIAPHLSTAAEVNTYLNSIKN